MIFSREIFHRETHGNRLLISSIGFFCGVRLLSDVPRLRSYLPDAPGIFAAVPYCIDLIGGPYIETNEAVVKAFRPKSAVRKK